MQKHIKPINTLFTNLSTGVAIWAMLDYMLRSTNRVEVFVVAFALLWLGTNFALWVYHNIISPAAKSIIKNSK